MDMLADKTNDLIELTTAIVSAYVTKNALSPSDVPKLITDIYGALDGLQNPAKAVVPVEPLKPAVSIRKSITPDHLVCLEDGKHFKSLKRHLQNDHQLTMEQYRVKWKLPTDYPSVAPNYSATRSALAKSIGLGRKPGKLAPKRRKVAAARV
jgi:predicted transcriptional regulator